MLYARLLGACWTQLAEPVRLLHTTDAPVHATGRFCIAHGSGRGARALARLLRLPRESGAAETHLTITPRADGEQWQRIFDDVRLDTLQHEADARALAERIGVLELRFRLEVLDGGLVFRQIDAALMLGSVRVRLPKACAPRVAAREDAAEASQLHVHVDVTFPAVGSVLTYDGTIHIQDRRG